jgi:hypothetical protein
MATVTLKNGIKIEGASDELIKSLLKEEEDGEHYDSATHGKIKIKDMATPHLKNAVLKSLKDEIDSVRGLDRASIVNHLKRGLGTGSITTLAMVKELSRRID